MAKGEHQLLFSSYTRETELQLELHPKFKDILVILHSEGAADVGGGFPVFS